MIGENIRKARKAAGVSQKELAERLQVYQKDISRWENGERTQLWKCLQKSVESLTPLLMKF